MIHAPFNNPKIDCQYAGSGYETVVYSDGDVRTVCRECAELLTAASKTDSSHSSTKGEKEHGQADARTS